MFLCILHAAGRNGYASGISAPDTLTIQNKANVTAKSEVEGFALCGEDRVVIDDSEVYATNQKMNVAYAPVGKLEIMRGTVNASSEEDSAIYCVGNGSGNNRDRDRLQARGVHRLRL